MPFLKLPIAAEGPIVSLYVGVSAPRLNALKEAKKNPPKPILVKLLIDTGASVSAIDTQHVLALGLDPTGTIEIVTPSTGNNTATVPQYDVSLVITFPPPQQGHVLSFTTGVMTSEFKKRTGFDGLLGRDVLAQCLFIYDGKDQHGTIAV